MKKYKWVFNQWQEISNPIPLGIFDLKKNDILAKKPRNRGKMC